MTKALRAAFDAASKLPEDQQEALAAAILHEVALEQRWDTALATSGGALEELADEALAEQRAGRSEPLDPEELRLPGRRPDFARCSRRFRRTSRLRARRAAF
jgi:hypothetical protein